MQIISRAAPPTCSRLQLQCSMKAHIICSSFFFFCIIVIIYYLCRLKIIFSDVMFSLYSVFECCTIWIASLGATRILKKWCTLHLSRKWKMCHMWWECCLLLYQYGHDVHLGLKCHALKAMLATKKLVSKCFAKKCREMPHVQTGGRAHTVTQKKKKRKRPIYSWIET